MRCFYPLPAWQPEAGGSLVFYEKAGSRPLVIRCGQCIGCRLKRSCEWAVRCIHESQCWKRSVFVTLTYDDAHLPVDHSLHYVDFQLFMKRLRKYFASERQRIRFYMCGEYGEQFGRPHFHALLFGCSFSDSYYWRKSSAGFDLYRSDVLEGLWCDDKGVSLGHCEIGEVTFDSAAYCARYIMKKKFGDVANEHSAYLYVDDYGEVHHRMPEFSHMSLKPGIGAIWYERFGSEIEPQDQVVVDGGIHSVPKYYDKIRKAVNPLSFESVVFEREVKALLNNDDSTPARLRVQETVAAARLSFKLRTME